jgi:hypothetical protein
VLHLIGVERDVDKQRCPTASKTLDCHLPTARLDAVDQTGQPRALTNSGPADSVVTNLEAKGSHCTEGAIRPLPHWVWRLPGRTVNAASNILETHNETGKSDTNASGDISTMASAVASFRRRQRPSEPPSCPHFGVPASNHQTRWRHSGIQDAERTRVRISVAVTSMSAPIDPS